MDCSTKMNCLKFLLYTGFMNQFGDIRGLDGDGSRVCWIGLTAAIGRPGGSGGRGGGGRREGDCGGGRVTAAGMVAGRERRWRVVDGREGRALGRVEGAGEGVGGHQVGREQGSARVVADHGGAAAEVAPSIRHRYGQLGRAHGGAPHHHLVLVALGQTGRGGSGHGVKVGVVVGGLEVGRMIIGGGDNMTVLLGRGG
jgi:hypothetical protein